MGVGGDSIFRENPMLYAVGPYVTADWVWIGLSVGGHVPLQHSRYAYGRVYNDWDPSRAVSKPGGNITGTVPEALPARKG